MVRVKIKALFFSSAYDQVKYWGNCRLNLCQQKQSRMYMLLIAKWPEDFEAIKIQWDISLVLKICQANK